MARRRKKIDDSINHERWLVSYADFITLLFAFFVVMYSISSVNTGKYRVLSDTLEATFTDPKRALDLIQVGDITQGDGPQTPQKKEQPAIPNSVVEAQPVTIFSPPPVSEETIRSINELSKQLHSKLDKLIKNKDVIIKKGKDWIEIEMKSKVLFYSGEARLGRSAVPIIGKIADILRDAANPILVEGFTDNRPINTPRFPSNWELSAARAASVVHLLERYGIKPERMAAIGYGEYKPVADNRTEAGRQRNRRVVIVVSNKKDRRHSLPAAPPVSRHSTTVTKPKGAAQ